MGVESGISAIRRASRAENFDQITQAGMTLEGIVGNVGALFSPLWDGGFAGISADGLRTLNERLEKYCQELEEIIQGFDETAPVDTALKGAVATAAQKFIGACKDLLKAYVTHIREEIKDSIEAFNNYQQSTGSTEGVAKSVSEQEEELRKKAAEIKVDQVANEINVNQDQLPQQGPPVPSGVN